MLKKLGIKPEMLLFFILIACVSLANGLSDSVYNNFYYEVYNVTPQQRGFIEFPREMPGLLCALVIAVLSFMGDVRIALIAQILSCVGLTLLGVWTPSFSVMLVFLFINSLGNHIFMPISDSIGMSLAEEGQVGKRIGQYASVRSAMGFVAALIVFFGFRFGVFQFSADVHMKPIFLLGVVFFALAIVVSFLLVKKTNMPRREKGKINLVFRKEYKFYYLLTILHGVQKQIAYVYGSWVVVDILLRGTDVMALLSMASTFICIFFMRLLGKWMDKFGVKKMLFVEAFAFIIVYSIYGFTVYGITSGVLPATGVAVWGIYALFILDRLSMQMAVVKSIYLRSIALEDREITATLSTGTSLDHVVSILAAMAGGFIWANWGSHWVFFMAAMFSVGNVVVAWLVNPEKERKIALEYKKKHGIDIGA